MTTSGGRRARGFPCKRGGAGGGAPHYSAPPRKAEGDKGGGARPAGGGTGGNAGGVSRAGAVKKGMYCRRRGGGGRGERGKGQAGEPRSGAAGAVGADGAGGGRAAPGGGRGGRHTHHRRSWIPLPIRARVLRVDHGTCVRVRTVQYVSRHPNDHSLYLPALAVAERCKRGGEALPGRRIPMPRPGAASSGRDRGGECGRPPATRDAPLSMYCMFVHMYVCMYIRPPEGKVSLLLYEHCSCSAATVAILVATGAPRGIASRRQVVTKLS